MPEQREMLTEDRKEKAEPPNLSDQYLEELEQKLKYALEWEKPILVTYFHENRIVERVIFEFKLSREKIECIFKSEKTLHIYSHNLINVEVL